jgi:hypothetical protein
MNLEVDYLIHFFQKNTPNSTKEEMEEQDDATSASSPSTGGGGSVPKWADSYNLKRGKANMLGRGGEKWNTGLTRGSANQIW